jgi:hypothetical protein
MKTRFFGILLSLLLGGALCAVTTGCATTWSEHGVVLDSRKARIAVLPVENAVPVKQLSDIQTVPAGRTVSTDDQNVIRLAMADTTEMIERRVQRGLDRSDFFKTVSYDEVTNTAQELGISLDERPISLNQLAMLGHSLDADAVLIITLSGYGRIKKKWLYWLIGSGIVEGVVQGVAASAVTDNVWVAVGVAGEEILQEFLTWGGGAYFFNRIFTPVIIEAELVSTTDGKTIWSHTTFARMHRKALKKLPEAERGKREVRLELTAERAIDDLLENLDKRAFKNVTYRRIEPEEAQTSNSTARVTASP